MVFYIFLNSRRTGRARLGLEMCSSGHQWQSSQSNTPTHIYTVPALARCDEAKVKGLGKTRSVSVPGTQLLLCCCYSFGQRAPPRRWTNAFVRFAYLPPYRIVPLLPICSSFTVSVPLYFLFNSFHSSRSRSLEGALCGIDTGAPFALPIYCNPHLRERFHFNLFAAKLTVDKLKRVAFSCTSSGAILTRSTNRGTAQ